MKLDISWRQQAFFIPELGSSPVNNDTTLYNLYNFQTIKGFDFLADEHQLHNKVIKTRVKSRSNASVFLMEYVNILPPAPAPLFVYQRAFVI